MSAIIYLGKPNAKRVKFYLPYERLDWRREVKLINSSFYHRNQRLWSIVNNPEPLKQIKDLFVDNYSIVQEEDKPKKEFVELSENEKDIVAQVEAKIVLKGYSAHTRRSYKSELIEYLIYHRHTEIQSIGKKDIEAYVLHLIQKYKISESRQNVVINAIKFYFEQVLDKDRTYYNIQRPKKSKTLPNVLSVDEIKRLLTSLSNIKHKAILSTIYSAGLRLSEVLNLRIEDIHTDEGYLFVKGGKGKKDRKTILGKSLLSLLRIYYRSYRPSYWLFEGASGGKYSSTSVQKILRKAVSISGICPWVDTTYLATLICHSFTPTRC